MPGLTPPAGGIRYSRRTSNRTGGTLKPSCYSGAAQGVFGAERGRGRRIIICTKIVKTPLNWAFLSPRMRSSPSHFLSTSQHAK